MVGTLIFISQSHSLFAVCCGVHQDCFIFTIFHYYYYLFFFFFNHMAMLKTPHKKNKQNCNRTLGKTVTSSTQEDAVQPIWLKYT